MRWIVSLIWLALAACGSGGGGASGADRFADYDALTTAADGLDVTPMGQLPASGRVSYSGAAVLHLPIGGAPVPYIADLAVTVWFGPGDLPIAGTLGAFQSQADGSLSGELTFSNGAFDPGADPDTDYQFTAQFTGTLSGGGADYGLDGQLAGDFRGPDATAIAGVVFGNISTAGMIDIFDGAFVATSPP